jgi:CheY-like chemotaxis protein
MDVPAASPSPEQMNPPTSLASPSSSATGHMHGAGTGVDVGSLIVMEGGEIGIRVGSSDTNVISMGAMGSGTSWQPSSGPMHMHHWTKGDWLLMFHYNLFAGVNRQGGPRGVTKFESTSWFMPVAYHKLGKGTLQLRGMFSAEPFTVPPGGSPLLFQTGETYNGQPLIDHQHPHDLFMELSAQYTWTCGGIAEHAIGSVRPMIERRKHELSVSLPAEPVWVKGDPTRLEQVIVNLLNNAAKYTDEGGHIWLTVKQEDREVEVVLRVRDTGVGIAPELLPRIFDLFTQANRTLDRAQGGLGIGLSLVQKLVELHGGKVAAYSAGLGQGSEFIVRLPALSSAGEPIAPIETAQRSGQTSRVLVVDDNVDAADMLVMMLQMFGHEVKAAYSGEAALETAVEYQPDFVLLDIGLPDMNGYEVAQRLRQDQRIKNVSLIAITGYGQDSDRQRSEEAGIDLHLVKPVDPKKLQDLLETWAKQPRSRK